MEKRHLDAPDVLWLKWSSHCNQVVGHGDDREEQNQQQSERHEGAPTLPGVAKPHCPRPEDYEHHRNGEPQEIE
jgi:hypothetical protein